MFFVEQIIISDFFYQSKKKKLFYLPVRFKYFASSHLNIKRVDNS